MYELLYELRYPPCPLPRGRSGTVHVIPDKVRDTGEKRVERSDGKANILSYFQEEQVRKMKYTLSKLQYAHPDDAIAIHKLATVTHADDVFLYKPQKLSTVTGDLSCDSLKNAYTIFAFGYQNQSMYVQWRNIGSRPLCIDFTHNTNQYDFYLLNFIAVDPFGKGFLVAFIICNIGKKEALIKFINSLKLVRPLLTLSVSITDDDTALYEAVLKVFQTEDGRVKHIHIIKNFKKKLLHCICDEEILVEVYDWLEKMIYALGNLILKSTSKNS